MKKILGLIVIVILTSCSVEKEQLCPALNSDRISADLAVIRFNSFSVFGTDVAQVLIKDRQSIRVEAHEKAIPEISLEVTNDHWEIVNNACEADLLSNVFNLQMVELTSMSSFGNSKIGSPSIMEMNNLMIVAGEEGEVTLTGKIHSLILEVDGNANLNLNNFQAEKIIIKASGHSKSNIYATSSLEAIVKDHAEVIYHGGPRINAQVSDQGVLHQN